MSAYAKGQMQRMTDERYAKRSNGRVTDDR